jgi:CheY-like chemotaxis protein
MKILVADDDNNIRKLLEIILEEHEYTFEITKNGEEAMAAFAAKSFDLVLTDINMPGRDGNALVQFVKSSNRPVAVVALTGEVEKASELFDLVLSKPIRKQELISTINRLIPT